MAVCVKGISFSNPMMVPRLVEWIELLFILGVDKIFFHYTNLARENLNVLRFYEARGKVELQEYIWAGPYARQVHDSNWFLRPLFITDLSNLQRRELSKILSDQRWSHDKARQRPLQLLLLFQHGTALRLFSHFRC